MRVAVIGAGIFGLAITRSLANAGMEVSVFEREIEPLLGSTPKSVMRLHLGLHYPRDLETAVQSRIGYAEFLDEFGGAVDISFPNYYAIAKEGSKVSPMEFLKFADEAAIEISPVDLGETLQFGFDETKASLVVTAREAAIDVDTLRTMLVRELDGRAIFHYGSEVVGARFHREKWFVDNLGDSEHGPFDWVVKATYGSDSIEIVGLDVPRPVREYHSTLVVRADLGLRPFGMTVIDGDYLTVLPDAFSDTHLLYAPGPSVVSKSAGSQIDLSVMKASEKRLRQAEQGILDRYREWFPNGPEMATVETLQTIRTIEAGVHLTDRRVTQVEAIAPGLISVLSGKIDHCITASRAALRIIESSL